MDISWVWKSIAIFYVGKTILRLGGRKSISQMTITQVIVMIGIGSLLIQPVAGDDLPITFGVAFLITLVMIITEYLEMKFDILETIFTGKSVMVVEDGIPNIKNLKRIRMSIDRLETRLRQSGISSIDDLKHATIEVSGQLGYELKDEKKPLTKEDFKFLMNEISLIKQNLGINKENNIVENNSNNIFEEITNKSYEGNKNEPQ